MIIPRAQARIFMAGDVRQDGNYVCASCGRELAYKPAKKALSSAFNQTELFLFPGKHLCSGCLQLFGDKDGRSKCLFYPATGEKTIIEREQVLEILTAPPKTPFVLSVPYSFKKHHWLFAGLSVFPDVRVGTDDAGVELDYSRHDVPGAISTVCDMLEHGVPRAETATGAYSVLTRARYGGKLLEWERILAPLRPCGGVELFVRYAPAVKKKMPFEKEVEDVFTDTEKRAAGLLADIAGASLYRQENGLVFWKSFFIRRVQRFSSMDLHGFVSSLCGACSCPGSDLGFVTGTVSGLTDDEEKAVMEAVSTKPDLLVAAAYTALKERQGKK